MLAGYGHLLAAGRRLQWDAEAIDLRKDRLPAGAPGAALTALVAGFCVAEAAVATHLDPYVAAAGAGTVAAECLALQQGDERRHARFFARVAEEVLGLGDAADARALAAPAVVRLFEEELPAAAEALAGGDASLAGAVGLYHLVLEGIVFAIGQDALLELAAHAGTLPGLVAGATRVQADERWHVGLGVTLLAEAGDGAGVDAAAARAAAAWGPAVATPERTARTLAAHRRRLVLLGGTLSVAR